MSIPDESVTAPARDKWESWKPALLAALAATKGPVLEVGIGHYSTPLLHELTLQGRRVVSVEDHFSWGQHFQSRFNSNDHHFLLQSYDDILPVLALQPWSVVFLDHSPGPRRARDLELFLQADIILIHDYHLEIAEALAPVLRSRTFHLHVCVGDPPTLALSLSPLPQSIYDL